MSAADDGDFASVPKPRKYGAFFKYFEDVPEEYRLTATASTYDEKLFEMTDEDDLAARFTDLHYFLGCVLLMLACAVVNWAYMSGDYTCCLKSNSTSYKACELLPLPPAPGDADNADNSIYRSHGCYRYDTDGGNSTLRNDTAVFVVRVYPFMRGRLALTHACCAKYFTSQLAPQTGHVFCFFLTQSSSSSSL
jgi:hypothetical protein